MKKKDFEILFAIAFWHKGDSEGISQEVGITKKEAEKRLKEFEREGLIGIKMKNQKIYDLWLTKEGWKKFDDKKYLNWKLELGY